MAYSLPPAATFTLLYFLAFAWYFCRSIKSLAHRTQICYAITFFCLLRFVSFTIRVVLAVRESPVDTGESLVATQDILLHAGFLFLLYPNYILILKLEKFTQAATHLPSPSPLLNPLRIRSLFRLALLIGATLRIMAAPHIHSNSDHDWAPETIRALDQASASVFAVLAGVIVLLAIDFVRINCVHRGYVRDSSTSIPSASASSSQHNPNSENHLFHISLIVLFISFLLLLRQAFATTSLYPSSPSPTIWAPPQTPLSTHKLLVPEHRWYTLLAIPEFITVVLFSWPGLEPPHVYRVPEPEGDSDSESV